MVFKYLWNSLHRMVDKMRKQLLIIFTLILSLFLILPINNVSATDVLIDTFSAYSVSDTSGSNAYWNWSGNGIVSDDDGYTGATSLRIHGYQNKETVGTLYDPKNLGSISMWMKWSSGYTSNNGNDEQIMKIYDENDTLLIEFGMCGSSNVQVFYDDGTEHTGVDRARLSLPRVGWVDLHARMERANHGIH